MLTKLKLSSLIILSLPLIGCDLTEESVTEPEPLSIDIRLIETTDLHGNMMPYNYFSNESGQNYGFARTAPVIRQARSENPNNLLFDNGDLIQGSPMADYMANLGIEHLKDNIHAVYKAMNLLDYDLANIGNHEFNYGLDYLEEAIKGANFDYVVANVFKYDESLLLNANSFDSNTCEPRIDSQFLGSATPYFTPYQILEREFIASDGESYTINVGVIGFTPPNIMNWDKSYLECEVVVSDIKSTAAYYVPKMKEDGADIIVAIPHSGLGGGDSDVEFMDNATWQLGQIDGIDAIMFGHDHNNFPADSGSYDGMEGVDPINGKIFGKPSVMPGYSGNNIGVIDLVLETPDNGTTWDVNYNKSTAKLRSLMADPSIVAEDVVEAINSDHIGTQEFMQTPLLAINQKINSFFSPVVPDLSFQIVNEAQFYWGHKLIKEKAFDIDPNAILLSVSAPFKGGRNGTKDYTNIDGDYLTNGSIADLYVYDNNTPALLKLTAKDVREWLEVTASQQYQKVENNGDPLLNQMFRSYNYDVFYGGWNSNDELNSLTYTINVSEKSRYTVNESGDLQYDDNGQLIIEDIDRHRISKLSYNDMDLPDDQVIYVVTNNYRASQSWMPGVDKATIVYEDAAYSNRDLVDIYLNDKADSLKENETDIPFIQFENAQNFSLIGLSSGQHVTFLSSSDAEEFSKEIESIEFTGKTDGVVGDNTGFYEFKYTFE